MPAKKPENLLKRVYSFKIDPSDVDALSLIQEREGILKSEQIRRGIKMWLKSKGVTQSAPPKKKRTR
jgi:hypothetical protein